nr:MAG TPA: hypothetical protein [Caudoviricetes sp.]
MMFFVTLSVCESYTVAKVTPSLSTCVTLSR